MPAKVKHPVRAAYASLMPIADHLDKLRDHLIAADQPGVFPAGFMICIQGHFSKMRNILYDLEEMLRPHLEKL
ncbi:MAG: hypothetical protein M1438_04805 [Deltaproteobacteria bacterium]|nr:hypothetical protein [Deltaproteobacteria bacterium]